MNIVRPNVSLLWITPNAEKQIEIAGRTCYKSEHKITEDSAKKFIMMLYKSGHYAMLEHVVASVKVICDRGISHEIVRHRIASFAQESTRYCDYEGGGIQLIHPDCLTQEQIIRRENHFMLVQELYDTERNEGVRPQIARGILPTCTKTEIVITMNLREWIHYFTLRISNKAHPQIIPISICIKDILSEHIDLLNNIKLGID